MLIERYEISLSVRSERDPLWKSPARGSLMHGLLLGYVGCGALHEGTSNRRPYSQWLQAEEYKSYRWIINMLDNEASQPIRSWLERVPDELYIAHYDCVLDVLSVEKTFSTSYSELMKNSLTEIAPKFLTLVLRTPTAFKKAGQQSYWLWPEPRLIAQSALARWNTFAGGACLEDETILEDISAHVAAQSFHLQTQRIAMDGVTFSAAVGRVGFLLQKNHTVRQVFNLLCQYARFSGVGIKTAMGLGAIEYQPTRVAAADNRASVLTAQN